MSNRRYVFDTNIFVGALLFSTGKPAQVFQYVLRQGEILVSFELLEELNEVLRREKFSRYITSEDREKFLEALIERSILVKLTEKIQVCRDLKDDQILELAISGSAKFIITGDKDLLVLNPFRDVQIITPEAFLQNIESI